jgi:hypothetical protein
MLLQLSMCILFWDARETRKNQLQSLWHALLADSNEGSNNSTACSYNRKYLSMPICCAISNTAASASDRDDARRIAGGGATSMATENGALSREAEKKL